jgi:hypothetical protein
MHSALGRSPFEVLYNREPRQLGLTADSACAVPDVQVWLDERKLMQDLLRQHLERVRLRMKHQADKNRTERSFEVGDFVYLNFNHMFNHRLHLDHITSYCSSTMAHMKYWSVWEWLLTALLYLKLARFIPLYMSHS